MGQVVNNRLGLWRAFKWFFKFAADFNANRIVLAPGNYKIEYELPRTPKKIWLYVDRNDAAVPVCQATVNLLGAKIKDKGFTLAAEINGNECLVEWFAEYE